MWRVSRWNRPSSGSRSRKEAVTWRWVHSLPDAFSSSYDPPGAPAAADVGIMERGYRMSLSYFKERIRQTDQFARSTIDGVYQGLDTTIDGIATEWKSGTLQALAAYTPITATGSTSLLLSTIGRLDSDVAGSLVLTSTAGTPAAAAPATLTAALTIISEKTLEWILSSEHRKIPFQWQILPHDAGGGVIRYWVAT